MAKFLKNNDCCNPDNGGGSGSGDCIDVWKEQHEAVCIDYNIINAQANRAEAIYTNSEMWELKLDKWFEDLKKANEKADTIVVEISFFIEQITTVCKNAKCTTDALQVLLCKVKGIFDCLYTYQNGNKGVVDMIKDLKEKVECLNNVDAQDKEAAMACIANYEAKINAVLECQDATIKKILDTFKCAHLLLSGICDNESGLKKMLEEIQTEFVGEEAEDHDHCPPEEGGASSDDTMPYPCDEKEAKPKPTFPIDESDFYKTTEEQLAKAIELTRNYKEHWIGKRKERDKVLARKTSLAEAIKAAEDAESGK